ncbi:MAG: hypothetical protein J6P18_03430, partial [Aeriscardovia sp.]|nr:hypothetical protein [Aeriscardovia sp.]
MDKKITFNISEQLPGFNPEKDMAALVSYVEEIIARNPDLKDYALCSIAGDKKKASICPAWKIGGERYPGEVEEKGFVGRMAPKSIEKYLSEEHPGFFLTDLDEARRTIRYAQLDHNTLAARSLFASALKRKPWHIRVLRGIDGGWIIRLNSTHPDEPYVASKYGKALDEAIRQHGVGEEGWWHKDYPEWNTVIVHPGRLPTFPKAVAMPDFKPEIRFSYFGMKLPEKGRKWGEWLKNDWKDAPGVLVSGQSNGGKSVLINSLIFGFLAGGGRLVVCDDEGKSADFDWARPWVEEKGWGCEGIESCAAALENLFRNMEERGRFIKEKGKQNWWELDEEDKAKYPLTLLVADEIPQWASPVSVPPGLSKEDPTRIKLEYRKSICATSFLSLQDIAKKARYTGICFLYSAQKPDEKNGLGPAVRLNLASKIMVGDKLAKSLKDVMNSDSIPPFPSNLREEGVAEGCGICEIGNENPCVYKAFYEENVKLGKTWADILFSRLRKTVPP